MALGIQSSENAGGVTIGATKRIRDARAGVVADESSAPTAAVALLEIDQIGEPHIEVRAWLIQRGGCDARLDCTGGTKLNLQQAGFSACAGHVDSEV
jgi:hypothetical protein